ncbi:MAG TPA: thrombospondin type 3 repeat-containing protein [Verrucomicrobiae bacterium]|nr:thrombospondin type 3 repeat-containing protein [Verrucomicrobiae bacterium]
MSRSIRLAALSILPAASLVLAIQPAQAASSCVLSIRTQDISLTPSAPFLNQSARVYATVQPQCTRDVEGEVVFYANDEEIVSKPISVKANGRAEETWANWRPSQYGDTTIRVDTKGDDGEVGDSASITVFIDRDTDGDGIGDKVDPDDDNDGVPDDQDQWPLDPTRTRDTDHDGIDDSVDSDMDNDGLYNWEEKAIGTDPRKYDTDGDGVGDKQDAYPLDPKRWEVPAAPKASTSTVAAPAPAPAPADTGSTGDDGEVLGASFENGAVTGTLPDLSSTATSSTENGSIWDWLLGFGKWWLLAILFLLLGIFFFWQDKRRRKDGEDHKA